MLLVHVQGFLTRLPRESAAREPPGHQFAILLALRQEDLLTAEQELVMTEHLPMVRFIARRIHELPDPGSGCNSFNRNCI
jgi:hypothetical protein